MRRHGRCSRRQGKYPQNETGRTLELASFVEEEEQVEQVEEKQVEKEEEEKKEEKKEEIRVGFGNQVISR